jgi:hypothetical protein
MKATILSNLIALITFVACQQNAFATVATDSMQHIVMDSMRALAAEPTTAILKKGTIVSFVTTEKVSSKDGQEYRTISLQVYTDVSIDGKNIVFNHNNYGEAEITTHKAGSFGRPGKAEITAVSVRTVNGQRIALEGTTTEKYGKDKRGLAFGMSLGIPIAGLAMSTPPGILIFGITGFFIKGKEATIPVRTIIRAKVAEDTLIQL